jgi:hypothetical protein
MDPITKRRFERLHNIGYLRLMQEMAMAMAAPFTWSCYSGGTLVKATNGTISFVNTGTAPIGITADHVYEEFLRDRSTFADVHCQFGGNTFDPEGYFIDRSSSQELDLATFRVPEIFLSSSIRRAYHHQAPVWPPSPLDGDEAILAGGFPNLLREDHPDRYDSAFQTYIGPASGVDGSRFFVDIDTEQLYWPGHEGETINNQWGGQSGGPVYRVIDADGDSEPVDRLELVGIIYQRYMTTVIARGLADVSADGTINRS